MAEKCKECGGYCPSKCDDDEFCEFPKFLHQPGSHHADEEVLRMKIRNQDIIIRALMDKLGIDRFVDGEKKIDFHL